MSLVSLESEIKRFLATEEPSILCIFGKWGVGKTFAWNRYLKDSQTNKSICFTRYSYVSLFGKSNLQEIREAIAENSVDSSKINLKPSMNTLVDWMKNSKYIAFRGGGFLSRWVSKGEFIGIEKYTSAFRRGLYLAVQKQIICLDDIERRNEKLPIRDVMGLALELKEQKSCKVVILLNREALEKESEEEFRQQLEKIADVVIEFVPSPMECSAIAIDKTKPYSQYISSDVEKLEIVNIRVIKKLEELSDRIAKILEKYDERVLQAAIHAIVLGGYSILQPNDAPPLKFIKEFNNLLYRMTKLSNNDNHKEDPKETQYVAVLERYGWQNTDDFDNAIFEGLQRGYFDEDKIIHIAKSNIISILSQDKQNKFTDAWKLFHVGFENNDDYVLDSIYNAFKENYESISPINVNGTILLFKKLGRSDQAIEMLDFYVEKRQGDHRFWNIDEYDISLNQFDDDLVDRFRKKYKTLIPDIKLKQAFIAMGLNRGWSREDVNILRVGSVDEYYDVIKNSRGDESEIVGRAIRIMIGESGPHQGRENLIIALQRIAEESPMNRERVARYLPKSTAVETSSREPPSP